MYSINARYGSTARVCHRYASWAELQALVAADSPGAVDEQPLEAFLAHATELGPDRLAAEVLRNQQLTSTRGGIRKAAAAVRYAEILVDERVHTLADMAAAALDEATVHRLEDRLRQVPGHGAGARMDYLWMLAGDDQRVKPDRMVVRWLKATVGRKVQYAEAREALTFAAGRLGVTPWELDHAVWLAQRGDRAPARPRRS